MSPIDVKVYVTVDPFGSDILGVSTCGVKKGAGPLGWTIFGLSDRCMSFDHEYLENVRRKCQSELKNISSAEQRLSKNVSHSALSFRGVHYTQKYVTFCEYFCSIMCYKRDLN